MKFTNCTVLSAPDNASANGIQIEASQLYAASFHAHFGDNTAAGTIKLQASNDLCEVFYLPSTFTVTNWVDIPNQSATITSGASALLTLTTCTYRWLRVVYTSSSGGSTTVNITMFAEAL